MDELYQRIYLGSPFVDSPIFIKHEDDCDVEVKSIVFCRDCRYYEESGWYYEKPYTCSMWHYGDETRLEPEPDGFCAWGVPKAVE